MAVIIGSPMKNVVQCRICHDEDEASRMEAPCACCGTLKYAHRRCVQMWCNEKGDTICEICQQQFKPGYCMPPPRLPFAIYSVHMREPWEFPNDEYQHPSIVSAERSFFEHSFDSYHYQTPNASIICCRIVTVIFVVLLFLRHSLPMMLDDDIRDYSVALYSLLLLRTIAILVPMCVLLKACSIIRHRRRHQQTMGVSDEENEYVRPPDPAHIIHIH